MDNLLGECLGTMVLIVFGCGVCANMSLTKSKGNGGGWICIATGWGFAVTLGVFTATTLGAPQGDLNPAVTLAKMMAGIYTPVQFATTSAAQLVGAIIGGDTRGEQVEGDSVRRRTATRRARLAGRASRRLLLFAVRLLTFSAK